MIEFIRREIERWWLKRQLFAVGKITKVDLKNYMVRAEILTTGMVTNWLRLGTRYSGSGFGEAVSPGVGDEVLICFHDGNPAGQGVVLGRLYGKDLSPAITEDEVRFKHKSGTDIVIRKDGTIDGDVVKNASLKVAGTVSIESQGKATVKSSADIDVTASGKIDVKAAGKVNVTGSPTVNLNGESLSAVLYEQLEAALAPWATAVIAHQHMGNLGAPTSVLTPIPPLVLTPAKSAKVKLGG